MNYNDLKYLKNTGVLITVRFKEKIEELETCIDVGMKANIRGVSRDNTPEVYVISFDLGAFISYNRDRMNTNYYDSDSQPTCTSEEAGFWSKNGIDSIYFDDDANLFDYFDIVRIEQ